MADAISALTPSNPMVAAAVQVYALKQVQDTQQANVMTLLSGVAAQAPTQGPSMPHLGNSVDVSA